MGTLFLGYPVHIYEHISNNSHFKYYIGVENLQYSVFSIIGYKLSFETVFLLDINYESRWLIVIMNFTWVSMWAELCFPLARE